MDREEEIFAKCTNILPGHGPQRSTKTILLQLADGLDGSEMPDNYGSGDYLEAFENEVAALFGKEAAVFMPSGIMAQQAALRVWCERRRNFNLVMHPTAHLEFAEHAAYTFLHPFKRLQFGAPEFVRDRILTVKDFENLGSEPGAILLELPYRPLGGQLPTWDELLAIRAWAQERSIPLHMDGARIWACRPFYQKEYHEIAALFDSVYVSFYKDLGGLCGAMLLGSRPFIQEARVWQKRHGGTLFSVAPLVVSDRQGYQRVTPIIDQWVKKAQAVAAILSEFDEITIVPNPPQVNFFQLYIRGDAEKLNARHLELAEQTGTYLFWGLHPTFIPGIASAELHCWENAQRFNLQALRPFVEKLVEQS
jgi:threonine aldolase